MMKNKKVTWVDRCLMLSPYSIGLCIDEASFQRELKKLKVPLNESSEWITNKQDATVHFFEKVNGHGLCCVVCIEKNKKHKSFQVAGLLAHEAVHVWQAIKNSLGERHPSDEFEAYSIQAITQRLLEAYEKI